MNRPSKAVRQFAGGLVVAVFALAAASVFIGVENFVLNHFDHKPIASVTVSAETPHPEAQGMNNEQSATSVVAGVLIKEHVRYEPDKKNPNLFRRVTTYEAKDMFALLEGAEERQAVSETPSGGMSETVCFDPNTGNPVPCEVPTPPPPMPAEKVHVGHGATAEAALADFLKHYKPDPDLQVFEDAFGWAQLGDK